MTRSSCKGNRAHGRDRRWREIEIDSASVIRGSPEHRVPCVTSKVHGPRSSAVRVRTRVYRAHPSNEAIDVPLLVTRSFRHLIHPHAVIRTTIVEPALPFLQPVFPSSHFPPLRRDGKIRAISVQMQMRPKKSSKKPRVLTGERRAFPYGGAINLEILDLRSACFAFQL